MRYASPLLQRYRSCFITSVALTAITLLVTVTVAAQGPAVASPEKELAQELDKYPGLLDEFGRLLQKMQQGVQFPAPRGQSRLLPFLPESTIFYAALPNYGEAAHQALVIFRQELQQSPVLRAWWQHGELATTGPRIEDSLEKFYHLSQYLGDEVVVSGGASEGRKDPSLLLLAEVRKPGLKIFLQGLAKELSGPSGSAVRILNVRELATAKEMLPQQRLVVLVGPDSVAAALDVATLRSFNARLERNSREFAMTEFGQRVALAYQGGATVVGAIDVQKLLTQLPKGSPQDQAAFQRTGFADMKYLVWEHKRVAGETTSQIELSFTGPRHGVASWLAAPGPMGSLEFVSPQAMMVVSVLLKSPVQIFDDVKDLSTASNPNALAGLAQMEAALNLSVREEVLSRLGGEITLELDNLVQTQPAWRAILRVKDPDRLQASVNTLLALARLNAQPSAERELNSFILQIPSGQKKLEISYAFVDGYLVIASSHQKLMEAVQLHHNGQSLAKSRKFLGALPPSPWSQVSALFYEDPVAITALQMRRLLPGMAESFRQAMSEDSALVIGAYGEESALREVTRNEGFDPAVILVVAAVAVPNLLRARLADGASAAGLIRTANVAQVTYAATYPDRGFAPDLATLGLDPQGANRVSAQHAGLIGDELGNPACTAGTWCSKSGFRFTLTGVCKQQHCDEYVVVATPLSASTGSRSFCSTSDAVVRYKIGPPLSAPISVEECQGWLALE